MKKPPLPPLPYAKINKVMRDKERHPCKKEGCKRFAFSNFDYCWSCYMGRKKSNNYKYRTKVPKKENGKTT